MASGNEEKLIEKYVNLMAKSINPDVDPRKDFMKYACGNFNLESYDQIHGEYPPNRFGDPFDRIIENETLNYSSLIKVRNFHKSYENDVGKLFRDNGFKEYCGGFPAFDENWTGENFDWIKAAAVLSAMNLHSVISYSIKYLDGKRKVEVSKAFASIDFSVEELLEKVGISSDKISEIANDFATINEMSDSRDPDGNVNELKEEFLNRFFELATGVPLSDEDALELENYDASSIKGFLEIFSEMEPKCVANFIMCQAIFKHYEDHILTILNKLEMNYFSSVIVAAGFSKFWNAEESKKREETRNRYLSTFELFKDKFDDNPKSTDAFLMGFDEIADHIAKNFPQSQVDQEYESLETVPDNYFQNILNVAKLGATPSLKKYFSEGDEFMMYKTLTFMQDIVNTNSKPMIFHFSGWEVEMWRQKINTTKIIMNTSEYKVLMDAIAMQMITFNIPEDSDLVSTCASVCEALKFAFMEYKAWLNDNNHLAEKQAELLKGLNLTNHQAFFVSFAQHYYGADNLDPNIPLLCLLNSDDFAHEFGIKRTI